MLGQIINNFIVIRCLYLIVIPIPKEKGQVPPKRPYVHQKQGNVTNQKVLGLLVCNAELLGDYRRFGKPKCPHLYVKRFYSLCSLFSFCLMTFIAQTVHTLCKVKKGKVIPLQT
jgi:hypothetical protein